MEHALSERLPTSDAEPTRLHAAMRYSVLDGGERVRPLLLFGTARALGLSEAEVEAAACAIELVHAYSLVHDDLPALEDDAVRCGRPACHKAYDEGTAVLVGDALQSLAFQLLAGDAALPASADFAARRGDRRERSHRRAVARCRGEERAAVRSRAGSQQRAANRVIDPRQCADGRRVRATARLAAAGTARQVCDGSRARIADAA
jgi:hypothetical protein